mgnify:CR=1 FL=1
MKTVITTLLLLCTLISCGQEKSNNTTTQTLSWVGKAAVGGYAPEGTLEVKDINAVIEGDTLHELTVTIDMKSLDQENKQLKKHLRDKDFFHVKKYPEAIFKLTQPLQIGTATEIIGDMTIKQTTQEEIIPVTIFREGTTVLISFEHTMNRIDYGITYNSPSVFEKIKENAIADDIVLKGTLRIAE